MLRNSALSYLILLQCVERGIRGLRSGLGCRHAGVVITISRVYGKFALRTLPKADVGYGKLS